MTSMRTFEALACGKPFLAPNSDAYARHGEHLAVVGSPAEALQWANRLLGAEGSRIASAGRELVLSRHTYGHRVQTMIDAVVGWLR